MILELIAVTTLAGGQVQGGQVQGGQVQGGQVQGGQVQGGQVQGGQVQGGQVQGQLIHSAIERISSAQATHNGQPVQQVWPYGNQLYMLKNGSWYTGQSLVGLVLNGLGPEDIGIATGEYGAYDLRIDAVIQDPVQGINMINPNDPSVAHLRSNSDVWLYRVSVRPRGSIGGWNSLCSAKYGSDPLKWFQETPDSRTAMFINGYFRERTGYDLRPESLSNGYFSFACHDGVGAKCARWGYKWWAWAWKNNAQVDMRALYTSCVRTATADYCGNGVSYTRNGTRVDIWDNYGLVLPESESAQPGYVDEAAFSSDGAECIERARWADIGQCSSTLTTVTYPNYCTDRTDPRCGGGFIKPRVTTMQQYEQGSLSSCPKAAAPYSRVRVASSTYCTHGTGTVGDPLSKTCNTLTACVCASTPSCCQPLAEGGYWSSACVQMATFCTYFDPGGGFAL